MHTPRHSTTARHGVTLVELLVVITIIGILMAVLFTAMAPAQRAARELQEKENLRQIHGGFKAYAASHKNQNPTPGLVRRGMRDFDGDGIGDRFVDGSGPEDASQNDHGAMLSLCIMNNLIEPNQLISPNEPSGHVYALKDFNYNIYGKVDDEGRPHRWDPSFSNHLLGEGDALNPGCNNSYAIMPLAGERRRDNWDRQGSSTFPLLGTRGPMDGDTVHIYLPEGGGNPASITGQLLATPGAWRGIQVFSDGHTEISDGFYPEQLAYRNSAGIDVPDNIFDAERPASGSWAGSLLKLGPDALLTHVDSMEAMSGVNPLDAEFEPLHD
ncbi:MAG: type II secretion system GspH family protein [Phycisphaerales bacterium]|nr:type II secretion system GspH family protein [Phycisphaerales bacterium]